MEWKRREKIVCKHKLSLSLSHKHTFNKLNKQTNSRRFDCKISSKHLLHSVNWVVDTKNTSSHFFHGKQLIATSRSAFWLHLSLQKHFNEIPIKSQQILSMVLKPFYLLFVVRKMCILLGQIIINARCYANRSNIFGLKLLPIKFSWILTNSHALSLFTLYPNKNVMNSQFTDPITQNTGTLVHIPHFEHTQYFPFLHIFFSIILEKQTINEKMNIAFGFTNLFRKIISFLTFDHFWHFISLGLPRNKRKKILHSPTHSFGFCVCAHVGIFQHRIRTKCNQHAYRIGNSLISGGFGLPK